MERWLDCRVSEGMFPEEVAVIVDAGVGGPSSFFVSRDNVRLAEEAIGALGSAEVRGRVRVLVVDEENDCGVVLFPVTPIEGSRITRVPLDRLQLL